MNLSTIIAVVFVSLFGLRMILWIVAPTRHASLVQSFYDERAPYKRLVYLTLFVVAGGVLIVETSVVYFAVALLAVGALFDFWFSFWKIPKVDSTGVNRAEGEGTTVTVLPPMVRVKWFIIVPGLILAASVYWSVFGSR